MEALTLGPDRVPLDPVGIRQERERALLVVERIQLDLDRFVGEHLFPSAQMGPNLVGFVVPRHEDDVEELGVVAEIDVGLLAGRLPVIRLALQKTGDETLAVRFLDEAFDIYEGFKSEGFVGLLDGLEMRIARVHALRGENVEALAALRREVANGGRHTWAWKTDYRLASLHEDVGFLNLIAKIEAEAVEQRAALEAEGLMTGPPTL